jgi:hypothetical protein
MTALMRGRNPMEVMWKPEMTRRVHNTLRRMIIVAMKWTLLIIVFSGKEKTKCGKVKRSTQIRCIGQNILTKVSGTIGQAEKAIMPFDTWNCLNTDYPS